MKKEMFKRALQHYRNQEELEEIEILKGKKYEFVDMEDGYTFPINDISSLQLRDYFNIKDSKEMSLVQQSIEDFVNIDELNKVLSLINNTVFFTVSNIIVVKNEYEVSVCEEYIGRELLENTVGQSTSDTNAIIINLHEMFNGVRELEENGDDFFNTMVYQFITTLLHELGHSSLRDNLLSSEYSPLAEYRNEFVDEEELVEWYAENIFYHLNSTMDVFAPFNREYILKHYNG